MNSKRGLLGINNNQQNNAQSQSSSEAQQQQDGTMSLVYPDGRVVKVRQKK